MQIPNFPTDILLTAASPFVVLAVTFVVVRIYQNVIRRLRGRIPPGLVASFQQYGSWVIWLLGIIVALAVLKVPSELLFLLVGLGGAAVIIAYHSVLSEIVASQFISTYQPVKVGDWIEVENHYGRVLNIDLIQTTLITPNNEIVVLPNTTVMNRPIVNRTRSGSLRVQIPVYARRGLYLNEVEGHLLEIARGMKVDLAPNSEPEVRIAEITPENTRLEILLELANPAKRDLIISEVQKRVYELMQELERQLIIQTDKQPYHPTA